jgi:hypothetical protein
MALHTPELFRSSFRVIANYPYSGRPIGEVFTPKLTSHRKFIERYPHLFQKIEWWEGKQISIKVIKQTTVLCAI